MSAPLLAMRGVRKAYGATQALDGVDLQVAAGEVLALVGENGAGKSTLMKVLSGAVRPDAGTMELDGRPYAPSGPHAARLAGVAMIYQELALAPHLSVAENILLGMEPATCGFIRRAEARRLAAGALGELGLADLDPDARLGSLPIAARQLVEIARAVALGCRVLVLDEPTSSLAGRDVERLFALVRRLRDRGRAVVYISHVLEEVREIASRFTVLRDGRSVGGGPVAGTPAERIVELMVGRPLGDLYPRSPRAPGEVLLEVEGLAGAAKPASAGFTLRRGEILGVAGLVGAGRTELLRCLFGLDPVRSGRVRLAAGAGPASPGRRWAQGMGMVSEDRKAEGLALALSVADNLVLTRLPFLSRPSALAAEAREWIARLAIRCAGPEQPAAALSGGNQQKITLARLLRSEVDVLLLDEPTRGVDVGAKAEIYRLLDRLAGEGKAVLLVSSHLSELLGVCDRVAVMRRGVLLPARPAAGLDGKALMLEAVGTEGA